MAGMLARLFGAGDPAPGGEWGPVCPGCGAYDWPAQAVLEDTCHAGGLHRSKTCGCGHTASRADCREHG